MGRVFKFAFEVRLWINFRDFDFKVKDFKFKISLRVPKNYKAPNKITNQLENPLNVVKALSFNLAYKVFD